ncbi:MAG: hypothetical protein RPR28_08950 [Cycloclasticus sp.]
MQIEQQIPLLEELLTPWQTVIGEDYTGYRNHVYRMVNYCFALKNCDAEEKQKIIIAAAFHDVGIWIEQTIDYLEPSVVPALAYLQDNQLESWSEEITLMITEHHKIRAVNEPRFPLVELFRQGDLLDFSWGTVRFGVDKLLIAELKIAFPNAGFHKGLGSKAWRWFLKHPLNPAPMMKW